MALKKSKCKNRGCRNKPRKGKTCETCRCREYRKQNPTRAAYKALRDNATRRGKDFTLTFDQFQEFCYRTNYIAGRGRTKESYSIDRIDNSRGYTADNIRVLTVGENARKKDRVLNYDWMNKTATVTQHGAGYNDGPF